MPNRCIYLTKEQHEYAKKQGIISQFIKEAIRDYFVELNRLPKIINSGYKICSIYWTPENERQLTYYLTLTSHTSKSAFIRHAVEVKMKKEEMVAENAFRKALKEPLEENQIIIGNSTYKIERRLD